MTKFSEMTEIDTLRLEVMKAFEKLEDTEINFCHKGPDDAAIDFVCNITSSEKENRYDVWFCLTGN